jgi:hypothetical protein
MALITCPDCGKKVSDSAHACPNCAHPFKGSAQTHRLGGKFEAVGFLAILAGIGTCFYSGLLGGTVIFVGFVIFIIGRFL